jgi:Ala-tRNA(Pro) deacylase
MDHVQARRKNDRRGQESDTGQHIDTYETLIALLDTHRASYRLIDHPPEGRTDKVSALRGHPVAAAAKCIVLLVKIGKKTSRFVLAVVPGDARVDTTKVKSLFDGATYVGFAPADLAERLAGSVAGTVLPFSFHPDLTLIADPSITEHAELFFNAARLDRSMALRTSDYVGLAKPRMEQIVAR